MEDEFMKKSIISQWNSQLILFLIHNGAIEQGEEDVYEYVLRSTEITLLNIIVSLCIGVCLGKFIETILLLATLIPLRSHVGGYHCKNSYICFVCSNGIVALILLTASFLSNAYAEIFMAVATGISYMTIMRYAPVPSPNKPLTSIERKIIGKRARIILNISVIVGIVLFPIRTTYAVTVADVIIVCAVVMILEKVRKVG